MGCHWWSCALSIRNRVCRHSSNHVLSICRNVRRQDAVALQSPSLRVAARTYACADIEVEGIFRVPGRQTLIYELKVGLEQGTSSPLPSSPLTPFRIRTVSRLPARSLITARTGQPIPDDVAPFTVAGTISDFFRSLPEPLLTHELYMPFIQAAGTVDSDCSQWRSVQVVLNLAKHSNLQQPLRTLKTP